MGLPPEWGQSTTPDHLTSHYGAIAEHMPIMLVTDIFSPRGIDFGLQCLRQTLDQVQGVVAIKDDFCGEFARKMGLLVHDRWAVWSGGQKQNHMNAHPYGCDGYLSSFLSFHPATAHRYWQAIETGDLDLVGPGGQALERNVLEVPDALGCSMMRTRRNGNGNGNGHIFGTYSESSSQK